tara:strand:- start:1327 stop:1749 length:423 start_codon:yes stop_codon:yes gene_type:complete
MNLIEREKNIISDFNFLESWDQKYEFLIDLGKELPVMSEGLKVEENLIKGCQSNVWLSSYLKDEKICFLADSDALITRGLIALLLKVFSNARAKEIALFDLKLISQIGLDKHLSMNRSNGLVKMIEKIKEISLNYLKKEE